jgi:hypothetical protein
MSWRKYIVPAVGLFITAQAFWAIATIALLQSDFPIFELGLSFEPVATIFMAANLLVPLIAGIGLIFYKRVAFYLLVLIAALSLFGQIFLLFFSSEFEFFQFLKLNLLTILPALVVWLNRADLKPTKDENFYA